ncbi:MAG: PhoH family protein [Deltaproteobacteria bacterium]|nr:PhoH family protein [Deltaproteobacteria bacterium]
MKKIFILDTNILLSGPNSVFKFEDNDVVIPISVIEEIDHFKKDQTETGRNAREVSRILDRLRQRGTLSAGIPLFEDRSDSGRLFVYLGQDMDILPELLENSTDNHILAIGLSLQKKFKEKRKVVVITKDSNLRIKADAFGLSSEDFEADKVDISHLYTGVRKVKVNSRFINELYTSGHIDSDSLGIAGPVAANEFFIIEDESDHGQYAHGLYDLEMKKISLLQSKTEGVWGVHPRNIEQNFGLWALLNDRIKLVTLSGGAGTGKTLIAIAAGLAKTTDEDIYQKLLVARPIFAMGNDIGFLPGDLDEKLNPWMQPIYDSLDFLLGGGVAARQKRFGKSYQELVNQGLLAIEPLTYIRGRSLPNAFFVVDESQNLTPHEIKTILTRAGEGTKVVLTGDPFQIDNPYIDSTNNGLTYVIERFKYSKIAAHITLKQGERSELATLAAELL